MEDRIAKLCAELVAEQDLEKAREISAQLRTELHHFIEMLRTRVTQYPIVEERRVQRLLAVNKIDTRLAGSLEVAKRAGEIYAAYLKKRGEGPRRILPDFLIGAHAETYASRLLTWNPDDFKNYLTIDVKTPTDLMRK